MIKRIAVLLILALFPTSFLLAQKNSVSIHGSGEDFKYSKDSAATLYNKALPAIIKPSRDFLMIDLGYNTWMSKPDSVKSKSFGYVFKTYLCYDFPIKKSKLSFATGIGISASVIYLNQQILANNDTGAMGNAAHFLSSTEYKRYKFSTIYLQAPFELRFYGNTQNRNNGFKAAIGVEVGTLLGAHTKGVRSVGGINIKDKENTKRYVSPWNFAGTARIGYGNFTLFGSYNITGVFKDTNGPVITPMSIGLCISGL